MDKKTKMHLAAASIHSNANFSEIRSVVDTVLQELAIKRISFLPRMERSCPAVVLISWLNGQLIGCFGELHPLVIKSFGLEQPVVALEFRWGEL